MKNHFLIDFVEQFIIMMESILFSKNNTIISLLLLILHNFQLIDLLFKNTSLVIISDSILDYFCQIIEVFFIIKKIIFL